jgi:PAS domain S-box-containing protein
VIGSTPICEDDDEGRLVLVTPKSYEALGVRSWEYAMATDSVRAPDSGAHVPSGDVTEPVEAMKAVGNSEEQFRSIVENASDLIAIIELDGRIRYGSPSIERVLGYRADDVVGAKFLDYVHPDDVVRAAGFWSEQLDQSATAVRIELRARHANGAWRSFEVVSNRLMKDGVASAIVINARDNTERKLLEAQLLQANRLGALGRLAATVAHEFNNVLMGMQPFAELMQRPDATPAMRSRGASHIANSIQRGKRIVLDILRFTQPSVPITTAVDIAEWWSGFAPEAIAVLGNTISLIGMIPEDVAIVADRGQLSQILANLVANARDAMPAGGRFVVEAKTLTPGATFDFGVVPHPDRFVHIYVTDTGHGIAAEVMDHIFEPLYTTRVSGGTGLGLAVAHQVVVQHGGYIFVESEIGRGTTFHLFFPRALSVRAPEVSGSDPEPVVAARKLLIIEDEQSIVDGLAAVLELDGIQVEAIASGYEAAETIERFRPDVILLDYGLPFMDGSEVYALIRKTNSALPIIFATGHGDRRVLHDNLNDPCTRFLQKPFEVASLLAMMAELESGVAS